MKTCKPASVRGLAEGHDCTAGSSDSCSRQVMAQAGVAVPGKPSADGTPDGSLPDP